MGLWGCGKERREAARNERTKGRTEKFRLGIENRERPSTRVKRWLVERAAFQVWISYLVALGRIIQTKPNRSLVLVAEVSQHGLLQHQLYSWAREG